MGWIVFGIAIVALLAIALMADLRDHGRGGKRIAGGSAKRAAMTSRRTRRSVTKAAI